MALSTRGLRWMGLAALIGGVIWAGGSAIPNTGPPFEIVWAVSSTPLCFLGVLGFYLQQRQRVGRVGSMGLRALLAGFACSLIATPVLTIFREDNVVGGVFAILGGALLIPFGFLLIGFGVRIPYRGVMLAVGLLLVARMMVPYAWLLSQGLNRQAGLVTSLLWAIGLAVIAYAMWSESRPAPSRGTEALGITDRVQRSSPA